MLQSLAGRKLHTTIVAKECYEEQEQYLMALKEKSDEVKLLEEEVKKDAELER